MNCPPAHTTDAAAPASARPIGWLIGTGATGLWLFTLAAGFCVLLAYEARSGEADPAPIHWPNSSRIERSTNACTVLVFAHPFCPCLRATLDQLEQLLWQAGTPVATHVVLLRPEDNLPDWEPAALIARCQRLPGAQIDFDTFDRAAKTFGVRTSGHVLVYDAEGRLRFSGGITAARGHQGPCRGAAAVADLFAARLPQTSRAPVFGCSFSPPKRGARRGGQEDRS